MHDARALLTPTPAECLSSLFSPSVLFFAARHAIFSRRRDAIAFDSATPRKSSAMVRGGSARSVAVCAGQKMTVRSGWYSR